MAELDRFKRRFIRAVARLMKQGVPEQEMWETLSKETGRDSQELWNRMKVLCLKKLSRLLSANDTAAQVGNIARMTPTDWLMFDTVLVHEKPDVCTPDSINTEEVRLSALQQLIVLVDQYDIEVLPRDVDVRAFAWASLTMDYNVEGRECSPMLLQLRWYQLKQNTRAVFYQFWSKFRGNKRNLIQAQHLMPSQLQSVIAKRYPSVITTPFVPWEEQIQQHAVVTLEEMATSASEGNDAVRTIFKSGKFLPPDNYVHEDAKNTGDEPDLVLVEPKIDTIAVDDSDNEETDQNKAESTATNDDTSNLPVAKIKVEKEAAADTKSDKDTEQSVPQGPKVKQEPVEDNIQEVVDDEVDGLSNVKILEPTHVHTEEIDDDNLNTSNKSNEICVEAESAAQELEKVYNNLDNFIDNTPEVVLSDLEDDCMLTGIDNDASEIIEIAKSPVNKARHVESVHTETNLIPTKTEIIEQVDTNLNCAGKDTQTNTYKSNSVTDVDNTEKITDEAEQITNNSPSITIKANIITKKSEEPEMIEDDDLDDPIIMDNDADIVDNPTELQAITSEQPIYEIPDDIEIVDDGIEFDDYEDDIFQPQICDIDTVKTEPEDSSGHSIEDQEETSGKFDLKLMMCPVVYTTKLDHMSLFEDSDFESVKTVELIDSILSKSKPVSKKSVIITPIEKTSPVLPVAIEGIPPVLPVATEGMVSALPVVIEENVPVLTLTTAEATQDLPFAIEENRGTKDLINIAPEINVEEDTNEDSESDYETIPENSSLFQKPRVRDYNPIKLCKNPDFNTRLKWLSVGFFASERNRRLLNACHPVTIDLHSAFEPKLVNNTVRLKNDNTSLVKVTNDDTHTNTSDSVVPSAMPVQSLIDKSNTNIEDLMPETQSINEENVISLEDDHDHALVTERKNKVINLPDIVNVRRLNQQLLTAEVAPIQLVNNEPLVEIPDVKPNINELTENEKLDTENNIEDRDEVKPSIEDIPIVPNEAVTEAVKSTIEVTPIVCNEAEAESDKYTDYKYDPSVLLQTPKPFLTMEISPIQTEAPPITVNTSVPMVAGPSVTCVNPSQLSAEAARKTNKPKKKRPELARVPWYASNSKATPKHINTGDVETFSEHSLIARDTLDRMLHIIMGTPVEQVFGHIKKKKISIGMGKKNNHHHFGKTHFFETNKLEDLQPKEGILDLQQASKSTEHNTTDNKTKDASSGGDPKPPVNPKPIARKRSTKSTDSEHACKCRIKTKPQPPKSTVNKERPRKYANTRVYLEPRSPPTSQASEADQMQQDMEEIIAGITIKPLNQFSTNSLPPHSVMEIPSKGPMLEVDNNVEESTQTIDAVTDTTNEVVQDAANINNSPYTFEIAPDVGFNVEVTAKKHLETVLNSSNDSTQCVILSDDESEPSPSKSSPTKPYDPCKLPAPRSKAPPKKGVWKTNYVINSRKDLADTCPIDLGPGQILLTTAKIPFYLLNAKVIPHLSTPEGAPVPVPVAPPPAGNLLGLTKIEIPGMELPEGVSLMLAPNGDLSAVLSADREYDETAVAEMQKVVSVVQQQISMSLAPPQPAVDSVDLTGEPTTANDGCITTDSAENQTENNDASLSTTQDKPDISQEQPINMVEDTAVEAQSEKSESNCNETEIQEKRDDGPEAQTMNSETAEGSENPSETSGVQEGSQSNAKEVPPATAAINLRTEDNIDNPLPQNSEHGSQENDTVEENKASENENVDKNTSEESTITLETNTEESSRPAPTAESTKKSILSDLMEMSGISSEDIMAPAEVPTMFPQTPAPVIAPDTTMSGNSMRAELTQVTTVEALKYAAQMDGKFFKYNLKTGSVTLIRVTIEKVERKAPRPTSSLLKNSFIDLTSTETTTESPPQPPHQVMRRGRGRPARLSKVLSKPSILLSGPLGYRRRGRPAKLPRILNEDYDSDSYRPPTVVLKKIVNEKQSGELNRERRELRKQKLGRKARIEAKIYLDDSDGPTMEEEYLVDSNSDDETVKKSFIESNLKLIRDIEHGRKALHTGIITGDSSDDDEPLAKKAKKKSEVIPAVAGNSSAVEDVSSIDTDQISSVTDSNVVPIGLPHPAVPLMEISDEDLLNCNTPSQDTQDTQESEEDECILGA